MTRQPLSRTGPADRLIEAKSPSTMTIAAVIMNGLHLRLPGQCYG
jgi:hypothetical protein